MPRRGLTLPLLAAALVGATLLAGPAAHADVEGRPGIRLVSHTADGGYPDGSSAPHLLTDDGRWALFDSASDLVGDGQHHGPYLADVETGTVSRGPVPGHPVLGFTPDGRYLVIAGVDAFGNVMGLERVDRTDGSRRAIDVRGGYRDISEDGDVVLVSEGAYDAQDHHLTHWYAEDLRTGQTFDVDGDATGDGAEIGLLSRDGSTVVFTSRDPALDPTLVDGRIGVFRRRLATGTLDELSAAAPSAVVAGVSRDGDVVAVSHGSQSWVITPDGTDELPGSPRQLTPDGRYLLLADSSGGRLDRYDVLDGSQVLVTALPSGEPAGGFVAGVASISQDGDVVAFASSGDGIVPGTVRGIHLYRRDVAVGTTELVCCNISSPARTADWPLLSATGDRLVFRSPQRLEPADTQDNWDVFAWGGYPPLPTTTTSTTTTVPPTTTTSTTVPPPPVVPQVSVLDAHGPETGGAMTWTVLLDRATTVPVTVRWWTFQDTSAPSDRRAAPDKDFKPAAGSVTFAPGETAKSVSSLVFDDSFFERDEWFVVELFDPTGATLGRSKAVGVINDDESARLWGLPTQVERLLPA